MNTRTIRDRRRRPICPRIGETRQCVPEGQLEIGPVIRSFLGRQNAILAESIRSRTLLNHVRERGAPVKHAGEAFPFGRGRGLANGLRSKRWIILTRDQRIRRRVLEREAIRLSGAAVFALTAGEATAAETAEVVVKLLPKMANMFVSAPKAKGQDDGRVALSATMSITGEVHSPALLLELGRAAEVRIGDMTFRVDVSTFVPDDV